MKSITIAVLVIMALALVARRGEAVQCGEVDAALVPCLDYLMGREANPPPRCCAWVRKVKELSQTPADKRAACGCVKEAAINNPRLVDEAALTLPTKCDVELDIPVSRTVDCTKIG